MVKIHSFPLHGEKMSSFRKISPFPKLASDLKQLAVMWIEASLKAWHHSCQKILMFYFEYYYLRTEIVDLFILEKLQFTQVKNYTKIVVSKKDIPVWYWCEGSKTPIQFRNDANLQTSGGSSQQKLLFKNYYQLNFCEMDCMKDICMIKDS